MSLNTTILDKIITHSLGVERLWRGLSLKYGKRLAGFDKTMLGMFIAMIGASRFEQAEIIRELRTTRAKTYADIEEQLIEEMHDIANRERQWLTDALAASLFPPLINKAQEIGTGTIKSKNFEGYPIKTQIKKLQAVELDRFIVLARTAVSNGLTVAEAKESFKLINQRRKNGIRNIIHTVGAGIRDLANQRVYEANSHLLKGIWLAVVFDNRTTPICIRHSQRNKIYPVNNYPHPPFHWNCRTMAVPITKSFRSLSPNDRRKVPLNMRASMTGDTPINETYSQWLSRQSREIQGQALGHSRAVLFRTGKYKLSRFIDPTGKFYTVDDLYKRLKI